MHAIDRIVSEVDRAADEIVQFTRDLVRIPTINPPGDEYESCARFLGAQLARHHFDVEYIVADSNEAHSERYPRVNVIGTRRGSRSGPGVHLNGHIDVVPPGLGWTVDPFEGVVRDGRIIGRGVCDMKAGIAAAVFAAEALQRAGVELPGVLEISGTVDEESGGFAGVAHLARVGRIAKARTPFVIIPEPLNVDRICIGHRGVYWFELTTKGQIAHGSTPFLGVSAIEGMNEVLAAIRHELEPVLRARVTAMPVVPDAARHATINVNGIEGGQRVDGIQTPCVADRCRAVFDRRFLFEETFDCAKDELEALIAKALKSGGGCYLRAARSDGRRSGANPRRVSGYRCARRRDSAGPRIGRPGWSRAPAPTIRSTSPGLPAFPTVSPTGPAKSSSPINPTSRAPSPIS